VQQLIISFSITIFKLDQLDNKSTGKYWIVILFFLCGCHIPQIEESVIVSNSAGFTLKELCDTNITMVFDYGAGNCNWKIEGCGYDDDLNESINEYGWYNVYDSSIIFYSDSQFGVTFGWHNIKGGKQSGFPEIENIFRDSLDKVNSCFYRNGQIATSKSITEILLDYGQFKGIPTPDFERRFGVYKLNEKTNKLELKSTDYDYALLSEDGIYYVTLPGLIPHVQVDIYCKE
jgi:hypothetical protein